MIFEECHYITKTSPSIISIIDMPLLDTRNDASNLIGKFISDIVLQILSFVVKTERENIKQRQTKNTPYERKRHPDEAPLICFT
ncbi:MAG: hypothetical protein ACOX0I_02775 [Bacilli bacterium]|jgi:hypothetical protein